MNGLVLKIRIQSQLLMVTWKTKNKIQMVKQKTRKGFFLSVMDCGIWDNPKNIGIDFNCLIKLLVTLKTLNIIYTKNFNDRTFIIYHRHLLKHPVVALFLAMKWRRMGTAYNRNLFFYTCFVAFLTGYIFSLYAGKMIRANNVFNSSVCVGTYKSEMPRSCAHF